MTEPALAVQRAIRARLIAHAGLTAIVPADHILDRNQRPAPMPSIVLGEDVTTDEGIDLKRSHVTVFSTLHVWKREASLEGAKEIVGLMRRAMPRARLDLGTPDLVCVDWRFGAVRYLRDPDGETSHGVVTIRTVVQQAWVLQL